MFLYLCASFCEREYDSLDGFAHKATSMELLFALFLIEKGISNECKKSNP